MLTKYRTPKYIAMRKRQYAKMLEEIHRAQSLGVRLLAGTDITIPYTYPGFSLHDELKLFVEAGLTWGRVERGYAANLLLLSADPLTDISNTNKIYAVVVNGEFLNRAHLDELLGDAKAR